MKKCVNSASIARILAAYVKPIKTPPGPRRFSGPLFGVHAGYVGSRSDPDTEALVVSEALDAALNHFHGSHFMAVVAFEGCPQRISSTEEHKNVRRACAFQSCFLNWNCQSP